VSHYTAPAALLLSTLAIAACLSLSVQEPAPRSPASAYAEDAAALKRGRGIFLGTCAGYCHSVGGSGAGDVPNLFDCEWRHGGRDEEIFAAIYAGVPGTRMIGFGGKLADEDLWKVVAFLNAASRCNTD
jgi:mono/diheme cytochrome c family protein